VFLEIIVDEFIKSEKLLQILIKLLNPQISFCKSQTRLKIQALSGAKSRKIFCKSEKVFCHVLIAPVVSQRPFVSAILPHPLWRSFVSPVRLVWI